MAAYWRSPYREPTNSFRNPDHSTLKFEQSLFLSRSRTSINSSKYDWLDTAFKQSIGGRPRHPEFTRSNSTSNIKSILKTTRPLGTLNTGKDTDSISLRESKNSTRPETSGKYNKKKVTFGLSDNWDEEKNQNGAYVHSQNQKCQISAMKRISHSRLLEESAMKKLNKLIGGTIQSTQLPSVKGKGLLSPRPSGNNKPVKMLCNHSQDLKCIKCIRKDAETEPDYEASGNDENSVFIINNSYQYPENKSVNDNNKRSKKMFEFFNDDYKENTVIHSATGERDKNLLSNSGHFSSKKEEIHLAHGNCLKPPGSANRQKPNIRLLPGRYPFSSGAMQIKKLSIPDFQKEGKENSNMETTETIQVTGLSFDPPGTRHEGSLDMNSLPPRGLVQTNSAHKPPTVMQTSILPTSSQTGDKVDNNSNVNVKIDYSSKDISSKNKTSDILNWLNDVQQKQSNK